MENTQRNPDAKEAAAEPALSDRSSSRLIGIVEQLVGALEALVLARVTARLEAEPPAKRAGSALSGHEGEKTKKALSEIVNAVVFESGILEKIVNRQVDQKLQGMAAGASPAAPPQEEAVRGIIARALPDMVTEQIEGVVERQIKATLSGEAMKLMVDDKFRAISLYLKGEVIPKTVAQILREAKQPA